MSDYDDLDHDSLNSDMDYIVSDGIALQNKDQVENFEESEQQQTEANDEKIKFE